MKLRAVIHSCSNEQVARAALISIGGEFAARVAAEAVRREISCGRYVALSVIDFEQNSELFVWGAAERAMRSAEQPILAGLYFILDHCLAQAKSAGRFDNQSRVAQRGNEGPPRSGVCPLTDLRASGGWSCRDPCSFRFGAHRQQ
jgi:hypothetical protein